MELYRIPKKLFENQYKYLSNDARVAYTLIYEKMLKDNLYDEDGIFYLTYKLEDLQEDLCISRHKVDRVNTELTEIGLLVRKRMKIGQPYRLYLKNP